MPLTKHYLVYQIKEDGKGGHVALMKEKPNAYGLFVGKGEGKASWKT